MNGTQRSASVLLLVAGAAMVAVVAVEKQATVNVQSRDWAGLVTYPAARPIAIIDSTGKKLTHGQYWVPLSSGLDSFPDGWAGRYEFGYAYDNAIGLGAGINYSWMYYKAPPTFLTPVVWMSAGLYPGHPAYDVQDINQSPLRPPNSPLPRFCTRADVNVLRQQVLWHEGAEQGLPKSHHATFVAYFAANDPSLIFERTAFYVPDTSTTAQIDTLRSNATNVAGYALAIRNDSVVVHAAGNRVPRPNCKLRLPP